MRLFADEDFDHRVVARLRALGHDVVTVMEAGRRGASDEEQLAHATAEGRVLITFNRADFHALHRRGIAHAGIITWVRLFCDTS
jgi:predicted nuclease of predicted toxin-antitoxin system